MASAPARPAQPRNPLLASSAGQALEDSLQRTFLLPAAPPPQAPRNDASPHEDIQNALSPAMLNIQSTSAIYGTVVQSGTLGDFTNTGYVIQPLVKNSPERTSSDTNTQSLLQDIKLTNKEDDDDFDFESYYARLHGTSTISSSTNKLDKLPNVMEDSSFSEIALDETSASEGVNDEQNLGLASDIAQNFSQLPQVLPHVASAVYNSFSYMLNNLNRGNQRNEDVSRNFNDGGAAVDHHVASSIDNLNIGSDSPNPVQDANVAEVAPVPLFDTANFGGVGARVKREHSAGWNAGDSKRRDGDDTGQDLKGFCGNLPRDPRSETGASNVFRLGGKKKPTYAHVPGLTLGETEPSPYSNRPQMPNLPPVPSQNQASSFPSTNVHQMPPTSEALNKTEGKTYQNQQLLMQQNFEINVEQSASNIISEIRMLPNYGFDSRSLSRGVNDGVLVQPYSNVDLLNVQGSSGIPDSSIMQSSDENPLKLESNFETVEFDSFSGNSPTVDVGKTILNATLPINPDDTNKFSNVTQMPAFFNPQTFSDADLNIAQIPVLQQTDDASSTVFATNASDVNQNASSMYNQALQQNKSLDVEPPKEEIGTVNPPLFFNPQYFNKSTDNLTALPEPSKPAEDKSSVCSDSANSIGAHPVLTQPPKVAVIPPPKLGNQFRMSSKRTQYYSGPIIGMTPMISNSNSQVMHPPSPQDPSINTPNSFSVFNPIDSGASSSVPQFNEASSNFDASQNVNPGYQRVTTPSFVSDGTGLISNLKKLPGALTSLFDPTYYSDKIKLEKEDTQPKRDSDVLSFSIDQNYGAGYSSSSESNSHMQSTNYYQDPPAQQPFYNPTEYAAPASQYFNPIDTNLAQTQNMNNLPPTAETNSSKINTVQSVTPVLYSSPQPITVIPPQKISNDTPPTNYSPGTQGSAYPPSNIDAAASQQPVLPPTALPACSYRLPTKNQRSLKIPAPSTIPIFNPLNPESKNNVSIEQQPKTDSCNAPEIPTFFNPRMENIAINNASLNLQHIQDSYNAKNVSSSSDNTGVTLCNPAVVNPTENAEILKSSNDLQINSYFSSDLQQPTVEASNNLQNCQGTNLNVGNIASVSQAGAVMFYNPSSGQMTDNSALNMTSSDNVQTLQNTQVANSNTSQTGTLMFYNSTAGQMIDYSAFNNMTSSSNVQTVQNIQDSNSNVPQTGALMFYNSTTGQMFDTSAFNIQYSDSVKAIENNQDPNCNISQTMFYNPATGQMIDSSALNFRSPDNLQTIQRNDLDPNSNFPQTGTPMFCNSAIGQMIDNSAFMITPTDNEQTIPQARAPILYNSETGNIIDSSALNMQSPYNVQTVKQSEDANSNVPHTGTAMFYNPATGQMTVNSAYNMTSSGKVTSDFPQTGVPMFYNPGNTTDESQFSDIVQSTQSPQDSNATSVPDNGGSMFFDPTIANPNISQLNVQTSGIEQNLQNSKDPNTYTLGTGVSMYFNTNTDTINVIDKSQLNLKPENMSKTDNNQASSNISSIQDAAVSMRYKTSNENASASSFFDPPPLMNDHSISGSRFGMFYTDIKNWNSSSINQEQELQNETDAVNDVSISDSRSQSLYDSSIASPTGDQSTDEVTQRVEDDEFNISSFTESEDVSGNDVELVNQQQDEYERACKLNATCFPVRSSEQSRDQDAKSNGSSASSSNVVAQMFYDPATETVAHQSNAEDINDVNQEQAEIDKVNTLNATCFPMFSGMTYQENPENENQNNISTLNGNVSNVSQLDIPAENVFNPNVPAMYATDDCTYIGVPCVTNAQMVRDNPWMKLHESAPPVSVHDNEAPIFEVHDKSSSEIDSQNDVSLSNTHSKVDDKIVQTVEPSEATSDKDMENQYQDKLIINEPVCGYFVSNPATFFDQDPNNFGAASQFFFVPESNVMSAVSAVDTSSSLMNESTVEEVTRGDSKEGKHVDGEVEVLNVGSMDADSNFECLADRFQLLSVNSFGSNVAACEIISEEIKDDDGERREYCDENSENNEEVERITAQVKNVQDYHSDANLAYTATDLSSYVSSFDSKVVSDNAVDASEHLYMQEYQDNLSIGDSRRLSAFVPLIKNENYVVDAQNQRQAELERNDTSNTTCFPTFYNQQRAEEYETDGNVSITSNDVPVSSSVCERSAVEDISYESNDAGFNSDIDQSDGEDLNDFEPVETSERGVQAGFGRISMFDVTKKNWPKADIFDLVQQKDMATPITDHVVPEEFSPSAPGEEDIHESQIAYHQLNTEGAHTYLVDSGNSNIPSLAPESHSFVQNILAEENNHEDSQMGHIPSYFDTGNFAAEGGNSTNEYVGSFEGYGVTENSGRVNEGFDENESEVGQFEGTEHNFYDRYEMSEPGNLIPQGGAQLAMSSAGVSSYFDSDVNLRRINEDVSETAEVEEKNYDRNNYSNIFQSLVSTVDKSNLEITEGSGALERSSHRNIGQETVNDEQNDNIVNENVFETGSNLTTSLNEEISQSDESQKPDVPLFNMFSTVLHQVAPEGEPVFFYHSTNVVQNIADNSISSAVIPKCAPALSQPDNQISTSLIPQSAQNLNQLNNPISTSIIPHSAPGVNQPNNSIPESLIPQIAPVLYQPDNSISTFLNPQSAPAFYQSNNPISTSLIPQNVPTPMQANNPILNHQHLPHSVANQFRKVPLITRQGIPSQNPISIPHNLPKPVNRVSPFQKLSNSQTINPMPPNVSPILQQSVPNSSIPIPNVPFYNQANFPAVSQQFPPSSQMNAAFNTQGVAPQNQAFAPQPLANSYWQNSVSPAPNTSIGLQSIPLNNQQPLLNYFTPSQTISQPPLMPRMLDIQGQQFGINQPQQSMNRQLNCHLPPRTTDH